MKKLGEEFLKAPLDLTNATLPLDDGLLKTYPFLLDVVHQVEALSSREHGMLLLPSGYAALLELLGLGFEPNGSLRGCARSSSALTPWPLSLGHHGFSTSAPCMQLDVAAARPAGL